ncbi:MAG: GIY-YIG nuclease family protein [Patescibacteria group bacterium]|nr:GIY-YIG nuclease family protein [Patescibacteria group bacterium]
MWHVYIVECKDGTYYTGVTNDLKRRVEEHNTSVLGSKYTRARRPVKLVYLKRKKNKSYAMKEEALIKKMKREDKKDLVKSF